jgi:hypothetical protein
MAQASEAIRHALEGLPDPELVICRFPADGASQLLEYRSD